MVRGRPLVLAAVAACALMLAGCTGRENPSALYVLEELDAASSVKKPEDRVARLNIFIRSHANHPYRSVAYQRVLDALANEMKDEAGAWRYLSEALAKETDVSVRGDLLYAAFSYLYGKDKIKGFAFADSLLAVERVPRLFLYMGYDFMDCKEHPDLATRCFLRAAELSTTAAQRSQAIAMAGVYLMITGRRDEAKGYLTAAAGNPYADQAMGGLLWAGGKREEALDSYIRCAARMPGARKSVRLDSLYAIVYPGKKNLDERIMALRIVDEGPLPDARFVDLAGKSYDLSRLRGTKIVINALSPT